ncbi:MAG: N-acylneuraminate-9-phosphate synthase [Nitrospinaceae bacterium]|mgnify:CR=1 FL=1|nr:N-acylneuraminate-9-phosphate synthase [Nitrospinaceae bacterium]MBT3822370.1 N-acylneuraminate-9-phosphate synthase [Nitrospinaceae bacterium]MBT4430714.1 N-acylneuraminate-9-phosphate synthase [Nitrospinaceae bacterium]MBT5369784.1 N-acylneuraminate-9-phosphate synthase [Nitrospinaceae bacterium]MBT6394920.1 N-acylneuraminate-9-phosphate synthase [Nitrospinaceae bacterium]
MSKRFSSRFQIDGVGVGEDCPAYLIAEAGVAHFGSVEKAFRLVDMAVEAGADAVKFQIFDTDALIGREAAAWRERLSSRCLPYDDFYRVRDYCDDKNITFFATAHDEPSLDFLDELKVPVHKIGSGEVDNWPFISKVAGRGKPVILSTGMYTFEKITKALDVVFEAGNREVVVLHCVTNYPSPPDEINLRVMDAIREAFDVVTGYSDHTAGIYIPLAAIARGARVLEKHISLDFNVPDAQDWKVSCGPEDLPELIRGAREIEASLGSGERVPNSAELESILWARKSLVTRKAMKAGDELTLDVLAFKRPGTGIPPSDAEKVVHRRINIDLESDTVIQWEHLN